MSIDQGESIDFADHRVSVRENWEDPWETSLSLLGTELRCEQAVQAVAPTMPAARFAWKYGAVRWPGENEQALSQVALHDWFVKVEKIIGGTTRTPVVRLMWCGCFAGEADAILGSQVLNSQGTPIASGDQSLIALGLDYLLDRLRIHEAWVAHPPPWEILRQTKINHTPIFNERYVRGLSPIGNRSEQKVDKQDPATQQPIGSSYCFAPPRSTDSQRKTSPAWSLHDILEYLCLHYRPRGITFELAGQVSELKNVVLPRIHLEGRTVREAITHLVGRKRGLGWCVRVRQTDDDSTSPSDLMTVEIYVFSLVETPVQVTTATRSFIALASNPRQLSFDLRSHDVEESLQTRGGSVVYRQVRVLGERVRVMFTLSWQDGTLEKAWSDQEETDYQAVSGADAEEMDANRQADSLRHVYTTFKIPEGWDWKVGNGLGTGTKRLCAVQVRDDGTARFGSVGGDPEDLGLRKWAAARVFEDALPVEKTRGLGTVSPEFLEPMAFVKTADGQFWHAEQHASAALPSGQLRMADSMAAVELRYNPAHLLAKNHWGTASTLHPPVFDWEECVFTVCCQLDERHRFVLKVDPTDTTEIDPADELVVEVPEAHLWIVAANAVLGVSGGTLQHQALSTAVRDDVERLATVAHLAKVWYGQGRNAVTLVVRDILIEPEDGESTPVTDLAPGNFLTSLTQPPLSYVVNTVITQRIWDFRVGTTTVLTQYIELDLEER